MGRKQRHTAIRNSCASALMRWADRSRLNHQASTERHTPPPSARLRLLLMTAIS